MHALIGQLGASTICIVKKKKNRIGRVPGKVTLLYALLSGIIVMIVGLSNETYLTPALFQISEARAQPRHIKYPDNFKLLQIFNKHWNWQTAIYPI